MVAEKKEETELTGQKFDNLWCMRSRLTNKFFFNKLPASYSRIILEKPASQDMLRPSYTFRFITVFTTAQRDQRPDPQGSIPHNPVAFIYDSVSNVGPSLHLSPTKTSVCIYHISHMCLAPCPSQYP